MAEKKGATEPKVLLGRPGNNVSIGIVGMPNVGKSSLFNILSGLNVPAENYPFCTIKPNTAMVPVPDPRFEHLKESWKPKSKVQAVLSITDIAGLVKGAAEGKGLGNAFLSNIQAVDVIYYVTCAFESSEIEHVEGNVDPVRDIDIIRTELIKKDIERLGTAADAIAKKLKTNARDKDNKDNLECAKKALELLEAGQEVRYGDWNSKEVVYLNTLQLLTAKPVVFLVNIGEKNFVSQKSKFLKPIKDWVTANNPDAPIIPFSVAFEKTVMDKAAEGEEVKKKFLEDAKVPSQLTKIITTGYKALNLINFFTTGEDEVRSWSIRIGTKAPQAAGVIHSDFEKNFICAEVYNYEDFKEFGSESQVKAHGRSRTQGKEYVMRDGDIVFFKAGSGGGGKR